MIGVQNKTSQVKANQSILPVPNQIGTGNPPRLIPAMLKIKPRKTHVPNSVKRMPPTKEPNAFLLREIFPLKSIPW